MSHDPLCPWRDNWVGIEGHECEMCALIAKVEARAAMTDNQHEIIYYEERSPITHVIQEVWAICSCGWATPHEDVSDAVVKGEATAAAVFAHQQPPQIRFEASWGSDNKESA